MPEPLSDRYKLQQDARKSLGPDDTKLAWLVKTVNELATALKGIVWQSNLNNGNVKEVREGTSELFDRMHALELKVEDQNAIIGQQQIQIEAQAERIENMAQWAKAKGKP